MKRLGRMTLLMGVMALGIGAFLAAPKAAPPALAIGKGQQPVEIDVPAPKLIGTAKNWLNTKGKPLTFQKGRVYAVEFWTFG